MKIGIESVGMGTLEFFEELLLVPAIQDVITHVIGLGQVEHDQIMAGAVGPSLGGGGFRFLVLCLAVNDARHVFLGILTHAFPDAHHVAAGGIHQLAAFFLEKAGMITTSFAWSCSNSASVGLGEIILMPRFRIWSLTSGLWMISPSR